MGNPVYVTETTRPAEKKLILGNDRLSVRKLSDVPPDEVKQLEKSSGVTIRSDIELQSAKETILKNSTSEKTVSVGTGENSIIRVDSQEDLSQLQKLQEELDLGNAAKDSCPDIGFSCDWFDKSGLELGIINSKYADRASDLMDRILAKANSSLFGNLIRCATYLATAGLKAVNDVAALVSGIGNTDMVEHLGNSLKAHFDTTDDQGNSVEANITSKIPGIGGYARKSISNTKSSSLSVTGIIAALASIRIQPKSLLTPFGDLLSSEGDTADVVSSSNITKMVTPTDPQITVNEYSTGNTDPVDPLRADVLTSVTGVQPSTIAMATNVGLRVNDGEYPDGSLTRTKQDIIKESNNSLNDTNVSSNIDIGNNNDAKVKVVLREDLTRSIASNSFNDFVSSLADGELLTILTKNRPTRKTKANLSKAQLSERLASIYRARYDRVLSRCT